MARVACWGLPWLALLAVSASAAYGMSAAVAGADSPTSKGEATTSAIDGPVSSGPCDTTSAWLLQNAVANGWMPNRSAGYCGGQTGDH